VRKLEGKGEDVSGLVLHSGWPWMGAGLNSKSPVNLKVRIDRAVPRWRACSVPAPAESQPRRGGGRCRDGAVSVLQMCWLAVALRPLAVWLEAWSNEDGSRSGAEFWRCRRSASYNASTSPLRLTEQPSRYYFAANQPFCSTIARKSHFPDYEKPQLARTSAPEPLTSFHGRRAGNGCGYEGGGWVGC